MTHDDLQKSLRNIEYGFVGERGRVELHADEIMLLWGYKPIDGNAWLHQHFKIKGGSAIPRKKLLTKKYARARATAMRWRVYHSKLYESE